MSDEEIKNKAKETSGGNYYYEQGFIYGFELGEESGRDELREDFQQGKVTCAGMTIQEIINMKEENAELKETNKVERPSSLPIKQIPLPLY